MSRSSGNGKEAEDMRLMLVRYLLGELDDKENERIEERYFGDNDFYTELLLAEDELIDSYVLDDLPRRDRAKFEQAYIKHSHRFKKVESNQILLETITNRLRVHTSPSQRMRHWLLRTISGWNIAPRYSFAALCLLAIFCGLVVVVQQRTSRHLEQARAQLQQIENDYRRRLAELQPQTNDAGKPPADPTSNGRKETGPEERSASSEKPSKGRSASPVIAFTLSSNVVRSLGSSVKPLVIPHGTVLVRLKVRVEQNEFQFYNVSLQKVGGPELWRQPIRKEASGFSATQVEVNLPASIFESGEYFLKVTASHPGSKEETLALHQIRAINRNPAADKKNPQ